MHASLVDESYGGTEDAEFLEMGHVDAVVVGIAYLGCAADHDNLLGLETVENAKNALAEGSAAHYGVVDDDEVVDMGCEGTIGDVIDVSGEVVAFVGSADESA